MTTAHSDPAETLANAVTVWRTTSATHSNAHVYAWKEGHLVSHHEVDWSMLAAVSDELHSYKDGHLCHPFECVSSEGGGICAHCGRTLLESNGYDNDLQKAKNELKQRIETAFRAGYAANTNCPTDCKPATKAWEQWKAANGTR